MSRYIDAERIDLRLIRPTYITTGEECMLLNIKNLIDRQPTADVVEVVRCKDCKHYRTSKATRYGRPKAKVCTRSAEFTISEEGFCSFGERIEDAN